ncbi:MerR family transcriptional regulator [Lysinibacillus sp. FSL M8-0216]|uniref:MerR family transcriptional regulator n=1 Tax=Lysinibacillus TaxID=400634 RepID=UPI0009F2DA3E|nr:MULTISPECIES: MerR family transcriptional regulator [Lysinibacillus]QAS56643.1 MerR family DNA-binding transcriptional regulator [Lysinibacillus sphaericus]HAU35100.1 MerR family DNA-binding transcriptional regulator [Lysinibacillus sp.]MCR8853146.1 MerR family transcriptional regulator [Lysinibacillus fusiformis]MED4078141.1 MerR family transcriptional regulator [Lysinibacillus fusiformis]MED4670395.1 MerR family transcriptional regulator [Lysinibacillus fusiformis]
MGELAEKTGITKRTIDYYTNIGLLVAERSATNYRYYDPFMIERLQFIEQRKQQGLSLVEIQHELNITPYEEIDVQMLRLKMQDLEHDVASLLEQMNQQDDKKIETIKKNVSPESIALMQSLLLLIHN